MTRDLLQVAVSLPGSGTTRCPLLIGLAWLLIPSVVTNGQARLRGKDPTGRHRHQSSSPAARIRSTPSSSCSHHSPPSQPSPSSVLLASGADQVHSQLLVLTPLTSLPAGVRRKVTLRTRSLTATGTPICGNLLRTPAAWVRTGFAGSAPSASAAARGDIGREEANS